MTSSPGCDRRAGRPRPVVGDLVPSRRRDLFFYSQPNTPKLRNIAHSPLVSFHLQSDPYGDHYLIIDGTAAIDASIPPLDSNERYPAKYPEPHAHWGLDFTQTALDFSVPIRIRPTRVRVA